MRRLATPLNLFLVGAIVAVVIAGYLLVPAGALLPVHWGLSGEPDLFLPKEWALLMPVLPVALVLAIFAAVYRFAPQKDIVAGERALTAAVSTLLGLFLVIAAGTVLIGVGIEVDMVRLIVLAASVLLFVLGWTLPGLEPNSLAGVRLPSTLRDPANWRATHRFAGVVFIAAAAGLAVGALILTPPQLVIALIAAIAVPSLAAIIYSLIYRAR